MKAKLKNAIIFIVIGVAMISAYFFFIKKGSEEPNLTTTTASGVTQSATVDAGALASEVDSELSKNFLSVLLSIQDIQLDDSIFSNPAFVNLKDSTILLVPDGSEGRPNPFAPIGTETSAAAQAAALTNFGIPTDAIDESITEETPATLQTPVTPKPSSTR